MQKSFGISCVITRKDILAGYFENPHSINTQIINMFIGITRYHLWKTRNTIRYDNKVVSFVQCYLSLKYAIDSHIKILLASKTTDINIKQQLKITYNHIVDTFKPGIDN